MHSVQYIDVMGLNRGFPSLRHLCRLRVVSNFGDSGEIFSLARVYFAGIAKIRDYSQSIIYVSRSDIYSFCGFWIVLVVTGISLYWSTLHGSSVPWGSMQFAVTLTALKNS